MHSQPEISLQKQNINAHVWNFQRLATKSHMRGGGNDLDDAIYGI